MIREVVFRNLIRDYMPLPAARSASSAWTSNLPRSGSTILYTSHMYQMGSVFKSYAKLLDRFSGVKFAPRLASIGGLVVRPKKSELQRASIILNNIVRLLDEAGIKVAYLYDEEPYSGALLLELGLLDEFEEYGRRLLQYFSSKGVHRVITVDPHTFNALSRLKSIFNSDLQIDNYLQLVHPKQGSGRFVMHDSCLYSKFCNLGPAVRELVQRAGVVLVEDRLVTAQDTATCCGAPVESVDEPLSEELALNRATRLLSICDKILVACPLCYQNLAPYAASVSDLAEVIS